VEHVDCVVIGAGVIGLSVARALALAGREVMILEAADAIGSKTSSRNSEVIHSGIYYPQDSLKAKLSVKGRALLYKYCIDRQIDHRRCGKLIVATSASQVSELHKLRSNAEVNGVSDLVMLTKERVKFLEPDLHCIAALHSPSTGIVDSHALMLSLLGDIESVGGLLALNSGLARARATNLGLELETEDGSKLCARSVVNSAGYSAPSLALKFDGMAPKLVPKAYYAKGNYFSLSGSSPFQHLIYPLPDSAGLGVHLTLDLGGKARFGPDVQWVDSSEDLMVDPKRGESFYDEVRKYWPKLEDGALLPDYAGIRPKICGPNEPPQDFMIQGSSEHGLSGLVNLFGIESPGITSCLAIGDFVAHMLSDDQ
jgi:L-2-hydroxyglutarate oxidase LhgO